jgi:hypothetical protein
MDQRTEIRQVLASRRARITPLFDLARTTTTPARAQRPSGPQRVRPGIQRLLDAMTGVPAYVRTGRLDILAANQLGHALYAPVLAGQRLPVNLARFLFLDPAPATSTSTGTRPPTRRSPSCAAKPAATRMTGGSKTWSGNCRPAARSSGPGGRPTTSGCTAPATSSSTTPSPATWS